MFNAITTLLEIAGAAAVVVALAIAASILAPGSWSLPAGIAVGGLGLIGLSFVLTKAVNRR